MHLRAIHDCPQRHVDYSIVRSSASLLCAASKAAPGLDSHVVAAGARNDG